MLDEHDTREIRCPRLGHEVTFRYCRTQEEDTLCPRILDCWWETFDVHAFLENNLPPEQFRLQQKILEHHPPPKVASLVELIDRAKEARRAKEGKEARQAKQPRKGPAS